LINQRLRPHRFRFCRFSTNLTPQVAHGHGGDTWPKDRKQKFATYIDNLLLVSASLNRQKGAKGLDEWLPPNHAYRCEYIAHFNAVMTKYDLTYIPSELRIVNKMVNACSEK
jgi:hypothetical protein